MHPGTHEIAQGTNSYIHNSSGVELAIVMSFETGQDVLRFY